MVFSKSSKWGRRIRTGLRVGKSLWQTASAAYSLATGVAALVNSESKWFDTTIGTAAGTTATVTCLNLIAAGTNSQQRIGNTICVSSLYVHGTITAIATTPAYGTHVRMVIFTDRESCNNIAPVYSGSANNVLFVGPSLTSNYNILYSASRWKILYDKFITIDLDTKPCFYIRYFKKFLFRGMRRRGPRSRRLVRRPGQVGGHHIRWLSSSNTLADTDTGNIYVMYVSDDNVNSPNVELNCRIRYYDN